ncbi:MAG: hypothetical protein OES15_08725 [Nitrosopumilus sp.]|nr:hypothetical protein [Nitrosopumilus sp.]
MENNEFGLALAIVRILGIGFLLSLGALVYTVVISDISIERVAVFGTLTSGLGYALARPLKISFSWKRSSSI